MSKGRKIALGCVIALILLLIGAGWGYPVATTIWMAHEASPEERIVPTELSDPSVSIARGTKLAVSGYEFEVPWTDLDDSKDQHKNPSCGALFRFRSGLQVGFIPLPKDELVNELASMAQTSPEAARKSFGSDYDAHRKFYEFTPAKMKLWATSMDVLARETFLLAFKSILLHQVPHSVPNSGIFYIRNDQFKGFQIGSAQIRPDAVVVDLYSDKGGVEFIFAQKDYRNPAGLSQAEINRVIQSLRRLP